MINNPRAFFKKGRMFLVMWASINDAPQDSKIIYLKIRRFVVIRPKPTHCLCLPINTYGGQATTKKGVVVGEHAALVPVGGQAQLHPGERLEKDPLYFKSEDPSLVMDPMSRVNFGSVMTVPHNLRVRNVGRLVADSLRALDGYFTTSTKLGVSIKN